MNIFIDTDVGDDIDDALALSLAFRSPEVQLCGITTVFRDAPLRAALTRQLLASWGRDVPLYSGISRALLEPTDDDLGTQMQWVSDRTWTSPDHAVDELIAAVLESEKSGEPLVIVAIGPLTNIAVALAREPRLASLTRLVIMGGSFFTPFPEWNIKCDPAAAAMVVQSGIPIDFIGLDVTLRCALDADQIARLSAAQPDLGELIALWHTHGHSRLVLHDPLALATLWSDAVRFEPKRVEIVLHGEHRGHTKIIEGAANARVAVDVDVDAAVADFMARITS